MGCLPLTLLTVCGSGARSSNARDGDNFNANESTVNLPNDTSVGVTRGNALGTAKLSFQVLK